MKSHDPDMVGFWRSTALLGAAVLMFLNWALEWQLPWPVILYIGGIAVACMIAEGEEQTKHLW